MSTAQYRAQVAFLVRRLPLLASEPDVAPKGGAAVNLFWRDLPRPVADRAASLAAIDAALRRLADLIRARIAGAVVDLEGGEHGGHRLLIRAAGTQFKIEVTPVLRGVVFDPELKPVAAQVEEQYGFAEAILISIADLFAGKVIADLDRQHSRDLDDVRDLFAAEGPTRPLMDACLVYPVSPNRPTAEVLDPHRKDITEEFARNFAGMTEAPRASGPGAEGSDRRLLRRLTGIPQREDRRAGLVPRRPAAGRGAVGRAMEADEPGARLKAVFAL